MFQAKELTTQPQLEGESLHVKEADECGVLKGDTIITGSHRGTRGFPASNFIVSPPQKFGVIAKF